MAARRTQRSTPTIARKIGDCEQSIFIAYVASVTQPLAKRYARHFLSAFGEKKKKAGGKWSTRYCEYYII